MKFDGIISSSFPFFLHFIINRSNKTESLVYHVYVSLCCCLFQESSIYSELRCDKHKG